MERTRYPGLYKRGGRYVVVSRHRGMQKKSFHRTLAEAREEQGRKRQPGEGKPTTRATFEDYAREWLKSYRGRTGGGLADSTRAGYRLAIEQHAMPFFDRYKLAEIEPPDVRRFASHLESKGLAPSSVGKTLAPLKAMYATAVEDGVLRVNPTTGIRIGGRRDDDEPVRALTRAQLAELLAELPDEWRLFFELLAQTGLRISEAIALTWADVEFGGRPRLHVRRQLYRGSLQRLKSRNSRRVLPLSAGVARRLWVLRGRDDRYVFTTPTGTPLDDHNLRRRVLKPAAKRAGVPWAGFHTLRHTSASLLFEGGKSIRQVATWLGHADPAFTLRTYVHLLDDGLGDAEFLDEAVRPPEAPPTSDAELPVERVA